MEYAKERVNIDLKFTQDEAKAVKSYFEQEGLKIGPFVKAYLLRLAKTNQERKGAMA
jgi:hypothetical protein